MIFRQSCLIASFLALIVPVGVLLAETPIYSAWNCLNVTTEDGVHIEATLSRSGYLDLLSIEIQGKPVSYPSDAIDKSWQPRLDMLRVLVGRDETVDDRVGKVFHVEIPSTKELPGDDVGARLDFAVIRYSIANERIFERTVLSKSGVELSRKPVLPLRPDVRQ